MIGRAIGVLGDYWVGFRYTNIPLSPVGIGGLMYDDRMRVVASKSSGGRKLFISRSGLL
jgi:hypothetical protein